MSCSAPSIAPHKRSIANTMQAVTTSLLQPCAARPQGRPVGRQAAAALRVQASSSGQAEGVRERVAKAACVAAAALSLYAGGAPPPAATACSPPAPRRLLHLLQPPSAA